MIPAATTTTSPLWSWMPTSPSTRTSGPSVCPPRLMSFHQAVRPGSPVGVLSEREVSAGASGASPLSVRLNRGGNESLSPPGQTASVLQKAEVRIINSTVCKSLMSDEVTEGMLCAGILKGGVDACQVTNMSSPSSCHRLACCSNSALTLSPFGYLPAHRATLGARCLSPAPVGGSSWLVW